MKLFYSPGACSLSPHITLHETGLEHQAEKVDLKAKTTETGANYLSINPTGQVPALQLDDGTLLTEGPAIVQYIADLAPASGLAPANGTKERYQLQSILNMISTELHKGFSPLFRPTTPEDYKTIAHENLEKRFRLIEQQLSSRDYLTGSTFTVADGYLFVMLLWADRMKIDLSGFPHITAFKKRVASRPGVQAALQHEGLAA